MKRNLLQIDRRRRALQHGGRSIVLQEKSWQVLCLLMEAAPGTVSRADIIGKVWQGNFRSGDKGLNQAIWTIRTALSDDAQEPKFIRTVPRVGYQWIYASVAADEAGESKSEKRTARQLAAAAVVAVIAVTYATSSALVAGYRPPAAPADRVATDAYRVDRDIHVRFASGCLGILKNEDNKNIGTPMLSSDGTEVAVTVRDPEGCRLVTVDVATGEKRDFSNCPTI